MNTPQSMAIGWGSLLFAGGISFYFAKKEIDARRRLQKERGQRPSEIKQWYEKIEQNSGPDLRPNNSNSKT